MSAATACMIALSTDSLDHGTRLSVNLRRSAPPRSARVAPEAGALFSAKFKETRLRCLATCRYSCPTDIPPRNSMDYLYSLYDALVSINVPNDKARAVVDAMERDMGMTIATKSDLQLLRQELIATLAGRDEALVDCNS